MASLKSSNRRSLLSLFLLLFLIAVYLLFFRQEPARSSYERRDNRQAGFRHKRIYYTRHAECRMDCRHIDEEEVKQVIRGGKINYSKSDLKARPCPKYAVEGISRDGQNVRIIVGDCETRASIITVIDTGNDFECDCK